MPVVYEGVGDSGHGDLFQGLKLWIARRVPTREHLIKLVKVRHPALVAVVARDAEASEDQS